MALSAVASFPPELLDNICAAIYFASVLPSYPTLDPIVIDGDAIAVPTGLPSLFPPAKSSRRARPPAVAHQRIKTPD